MRDQRDVLDELAAIATTLEGILQVLERAYPAAGDIDDREANRALVQRDLRVKIARQNVKIDTTRLAIDDMLDRMSDGDRPMGLFDALTRIADGLEK